MDSLQNSIDQENHSNGLDFRMKLEEFTSNVIENTNKSLLEDYWIAYNEDIDINIWTDEDGNLYAASYDVINGNTQTDHWIDLDIDS